jgi:hypothetical protein
MKRFILIVGAILISGIRPVNAQVNAATLQAIFLYSSIKYIEWPVDELPVFEIQVVGDGEIYDELLKISKSRKVGSRSIAVRKLTSLAEITKCHIVFIISPNQAQLEKFVTANKTPILIVTSRDGFLEKGSDLNFVQKGDKLSYQINESNLQIKRIKVSKVLVSMADKTI